MTIHIERK